MEEKKAFFNVLLLAGAFFSISQVIVERCLCLIGAICTRIRRCWMSRFWFLKESLWLEILCFMVSSLWRSCLFLTWLCIWRFNTGIFLVGGMCFWPYNCIGWRGVLYCWWMRFFFNHLWHVACATVANLNVVFVKDFG